MAIQACPFSWPGLNAVLGGDGATKIVTTIHSIAHRDAKTNTILPPANVMDVVKSQASEISHDIKICGCG